MRHILLSLCWQLLFWGTCVCMEQCRIRVCAPISNSEQSVNPNYSKVFWQTRNVSEAQGLVGTSHRVLVVHVLSMEISERLQDQLSSSGSPHCFREPRTVEAEGCMKPLILSLLFKWPSLRSLLCMWQRRQQWVKTLSFFMNMCALLHKIWNICHNFTVSSCG